jgi:hypothetical protein
MDATSTPIRHPRGRSEPPLNIPTSPLSSPPPSFFDAIDPSSASDDSLEYDSDDAASADDFDNDAAPDDVLLAAPEAQERDDAANNNSTAAPEMRRFDALTGPQNRKKVSTETKLNLMVNALRRTHWSFQEFLEAWAGAEGDDILNVRVAHKSYAKQRQRRAKLAKTLAGFHDRGLFHSGDLERDCEKELGSLQATPLFGRFSSRVEVKDIDFAGAFADIRRVAPKWHRLITRLMRNKRSAYSSYQARDVHDVLGRRVFAVTSMVLHSRAKKQSNFLASSLDLYFLGTSVHRKVIEVLAGFGLCHTYHTANKLMNELASRAEVRT